MEPHLAPFWKLSDLSEGLFHRLARDPAVRAISQYAFFPEVRRRLAAGQPLPGIEFTSRTRGRVAILRFDDTTLVIKPIQSGREPEIAAIAGELGVGPAQRPTLPGYLTEDFARGVFFTDLSESKRNADAMFGIGRSLGRTLRLLHDAGVYYNDATLCDPEGRSHLIVDEEGNCLLIDFGVSLLLDRHPEFTREEVRNFVRTLPMYRIFSAMAETREEMDRFLEDYRNQMARASKAEIMARDLIFTQQGLGMAVGRMGQGVGEPIRDGFFQAYRS